MMRLIAVLWAGAACFANAIGHAQTQAVLVVVGAAGESTYQQPFATWGQRWVDAAGRAQVEVMLLDGACLADPAADATGLTDPTGSTGPTEGETLTQRSQIQTAIEQIQTRFAKLPEVEAAGAQLWIVLIGHGTFDGKVAKFNLVGPDLSPADLHAWLGDSHHSVIINCASASSPFINQLSGPRRMVVTATQSGAQYNFARFGDHLSKALNDPALDLDKDQQVSLLECVIGASSSTQEFYKQENRLATELAMIDDNGDGLGTPADWFRGVRVARKVSGGAVDGFAANQIFLGVAAGKVPLSPQQLTERNRLELAIETLREQKSTLAEDEYYQRLEVLLLSLGKVLDVVQEEPSTETNNLDDG